MSQQLNEDAYLVSMYGDTSDEVAKNATRVAAGLKASGTHVQAVNLNGATVNFATERYVKALEEQIKGLKRELNDLKNFVNRMHKHYNKSVSAIDTVSQDVKTISRTLYGND